MSGGRNDQSLDEGKYLRKKTGRFLVQTEATM